MKKVVHIAGLVFMALAGYPAIAQQVQVDTECKNVSNKSKRLACYEQQDARRVDEGMTAAAIEFKRAEEAKAETTKRDNEAKAAEYLAKSKRKFDNALRSALAISAVTNVGVSYSNFPGLVSNLATEIAMIERQATTLFETDTIDKLNKLLEIYKDSITLWADLIDANSNPSLQLNADHIIFGLYPHTANITRKYNLPVIKDNSFFSGPDSLYGPSARSTLWNNASSLIETIRASIQQ